jgi:hypothetical protein
MKYYEIGSLYMNYGFLGLISAIITGYLAFNLMSQKIVKAYIEVPLMCVLLIGGFIMFSIGSALILNGSMASNPKEVEKTGRVIDKYFLYLSSGAMVKLRFQDGSTQVHQFEGDEYEKVKINKSKYRVVYFENGALGYRWFKTIRPVETENSSK